MFNSDDTTNLVFISRDDVKGTTTFERKCPFCHKVARQTFDTEKLQPAETNSTCIQNVLPKLTANEREFFMTGICPSCWDAL